MLKLIHTKDILAEIQNLLASCDGVTVLTAFLSADVVEHVFQNGAKEIEVFTSFHNEFVDPKGLRQLLGLKAKVYIYTGMHFFHPKVYFFQSRKPVAIVGSSNFTFGGLKNNIELNIITDESAIISELEKYISQLEHDPLFGILTETSLTKYEEINTAKSNYFLKQPAPKLEALSESQKLLDFSRLNTLPSKESVHQFLKIKLQATGEYSRKKHSVVWLAEKDAIYGSTWSFFPSSDVVFTIQFDFAGHSFPPIKTHITSSRQISGLYNKLYYAGFRLNAGDIICFEELESKKLYRLWLERDLQAG